MKLYVDKNYIDQLKNFYPTNEELTVTLEGVDKKYYLSLTPKASGSGPSFHGESYTQCWKCGNMIEYYDRVPTNRADIYICPLCGSANISF